MSAPEDYNRDGETVRIQYDWSSTEPSTGVIEAVAYAMNREPTTLDSLYDYIDFDALDALFQSENETGAGGLALSFAFDDQQVTVYGHGGVVVHPVDRAP